MKFLLSVFIVFTIAIRPVLPLLNYAVNYDDIVKNVCIKRDIQNSTCKGKCFLGKELSGTEKQSNSQVVKIAVLDVFISHDIFSLSNRPDFLDQWISSEYMDFHHFSYSFIIFHPPIAAVDFV